MRVFKNYFCVLVITGILSGVSGCQDAIDQASEAGSAEALKIMGRTFNNYHDHHGQFPGNWDELIAFETKQGQDAEVFQQLRDDGCVVNGWGLKFQQFTEGSGSFLMAYMPDVAQNGGPALWSDGGVRDISAADLQEALEKQKDIKPRG